MSDQLMALIAEKERSEKLQRKKYLMAGGGIVVLLLSGGTMLYSLDGTPVMASEEQSTAQPVRHQDILQEAATIDAAAATEQLSLPPSVQVNVPPTQPVAETPAPDPVPTPTPTTAPTPAKPATPKAATPAPAPKPAPKKASAKPSVEQAVGFPVTVKRPINGYTAFESIVFEIDEPGLDANYRIDFGDGQSSAFDYELNHTYTEPGNYTLRFTETLPDGKKRVFTRTLSIAAPNVGN